MSDQITFNASTLAPSGQVTLFLNVLSGLANIASLTLDISQGELPTQAGQTSLLTCTGTLWGIDFATIAVTLTLGENNLYSEVTLVCTAPVGDGWAFATAFPSLPPFKALPGILSDRVKPALDSIELASAVVVLSTQPGACVLANSDTFHYYYGCGFAAVLQTSFQDFATNLGLVGTLLRYGSQSLVISGQIWPETTVPSLAPDVMPWDNLPTASTPPSAIAYSGIYLAISLGSPISLSNWSVSLAAPALYLYTPLSTRWQQLNPTYCPTLALGLGVQDSDTGLDVAFYISNFSDGAITLAVNCDFSLADGLGLSSVLNLMGASDSANFSSQIPSQLSTAASGANLTLYTVGVTFDSDFKIMSASVTVGVVAASAITLPTGTLPQTSSVTLETLLFSIAVSNDQFAFTLMSQMLLAGSVPLYLQVGFDTGDDFSLLAQLNAQQAPPASLPALLADLGVQAALPAVLQDLSILDAMLNYSYQNSVGTWALGFAVGDKSGAPAPLNSGAVTLNIENISFFMNSAPDSALKWGVNGAVTTSSQCIYTASFADNGGDITVKAGVAMPPGGIEFNDLLNDFGLTSFVLPFDFSISSIDAYYASSNNLTSYAFELGLSLSGGMPLDALYLSTEFSQSPWWGMSVDLDLNVDLFQFQALSNWVSGNSLVLDAVQYLYSSTSLNSTQATTVNQLITDLGNATPFTSFPVANLNAGSSLNVTVTLNGKPLTILIPLSAESQQPQDQQAVRASAASGTTPLTWIPYQQQIGPLSLQQLGFSFSNNILQMGISAQAQLGPATINVAGLTVAFDVSQSLDPTFNIAGLEIDYSSGAVTVAGMLAMNATPTPPLIEEYDGGLIIETEKFDLSAIGSWGVMSGGTYSFFALASVQGDFGGPPPFFVTGLSAGFGLNRTLSAPPIADVAQFPLVTVAAGGPVPALPVLESQLDTYVQPQQGSSWFAAGVSFTSFGVVDGTLLLALVDGPQVQLDLLGEASIVLPSSNQGQANNYVNAVLGIEATYVPASGAALLQGQLTTSSYVMDPSCHLGGGFAVGAWFGASAYAGDFVVSLGGYNPNYDPPSYYPGVPRLNLSWAQPDSPLSIIGSAYFAVVPHCLMLGLDMNAVWSQGSVSAMFQSQADFIFTWAPFTYSATFAVSFTVQARLDLHVTTLDVHATIGAALSAWGPPFGGTALIDLSVFSFNMDFGSAHNQPPALSWEEFNSAFLPGGQQTTQGERFLRQAAKPAGTQASGAAGTISIAVTAGQLTNGAQASSGLTLVSAEKAEFSVSLSSPATQISFSNFSNNPATLLYANESVIPIGIAPMQLNSVKSLVNVSLTNSPAAAVTVTPISGSVPKSLWYYDTSNPSTLNGDSMIEQALVGAHIVPDDGAAFSFVSPQGPYPVHILCQDAPKKAELRWKAPFTPPVPDPWQGADAIATLTSTINSQPAVANRTAVLADLAAAGFMVPSAVDVSPLASTTTVMLPDSFTLCELGSN